MTRAVPETDREDDRCEWCDTAGGCADECDCSDCEIERALDESADMYFDDRGDD